MRVHSPWSLARSSSLRYRSARGSGAGAKAVLSSTARLRAVVRMAIPSRFGDALVDGDPGLGPRRVEVARALLLADVVAEAVGERVALELVDAAEGGALVADLDEVDLFGVPGRVELHDPGVFGHVGPPDVALDDD